MNHPNYTIDVIPSQIISHDQFCELSIITDNAEKEKSDSSDLEKSVVTVSVRNIILFFRFFIKIIKATFLRDKFAGCMLQRRK